MEAVENATKGIKTKIEGTASRSPPPPVAIFEVIIPNHGFNLVTVPYPLDES